MTPVPGRQQGRNSTSIGFTLVELLVVIVVMAILAGMVIPYAVSTSDLEVVSAARIISSDLQYAQDVAITSQQLVTVTFNSSGESYTLSNASGVLIHPINKSAYMMDFSSQSGFAGLDVVSADFAGSNAVTFDELGSPDNAGTIVLQAGPHVYNVSVAAATGRVTVSMAGS